MGSRRSRLRTALDRLTPAGRRRRSGATGSVVGSGALSGSVTSPQAGGHSVTAQRAPFGPAGSGKLAGSDAEDGAEAPAAVPLGGAGNGFVAVAAGPLVGQLSADGRLLHPLGSGGSGQMPPSPFDAAFSSPSLPPSPFDLPTPGAAAPYPSQRSVPHSMSQYSVAPSGASTARRPTAQLPGKGRLMLYQRSMLRLRSTVASAAAAQRHGQLLGAVEEGRSGEAAPEEEAAPAAEPEQVLEAPRAAAGGGSGSGANGSASSPRSSGPRASWTWESKAIRVTSR